MTVELVVPDPAKHQINYEKVLAAYKDSAQAAINLVVFKDLLTNKWSQEKFSTRFGRVAQPFVAAF